MAQRASCFEVNCLIFNFLLRTRESSPVPRQILAWRRRKIPQSFAQSAGRKGRIPAAREMPCPEVSCAKGDRWLFYHIPCQKASKRVLRQQWQVLPAARIYPGNMWFNFQLAASVMYSPKIPSAILTLRCVCSFFSNTPADASFSAASICWYPSASSV